MKKCIIITIMLIAICLINQATTNIYAQYQETPFNIPPPYGGEKNDIDPTLIGTKYAQIISNAYIDETGGSTKRRGAQNYDNTQGSSGTVLNQWSYTKDTGEQYFLRVVGSTLSYSAGDGNWTILISTLNPNYIPDQTTFLNWNIITNGVDDVYMWQGPGTFISSATFTKFRYIDVWEGRIIGAGVTGFRSSFYYGSEAAIFGTCTFGSTNVGPGSDIITGLTVKGNAWIFTSRSIHAAVWKYEFGIDQATQFVIRKLTDELGCLYDTSIQDFNNGLMFYSHLGYVHLKVGKEGAMTYRVVSENIDGVLGDILQTTSFKIEWFETTAADFGDGTMVNVDTTTTSGGITLEVNNNQINQRHENVAASYNVSVHPGVNEDDVWQTFRSSYTLQLSTISIYVKNETGMTAKLVMKIKDADSVLLASQTIAAVNISTYSKWIPANFESWNITLTSEATYYIVAYSSGGVILPEKGYRWSYSSGNKYSRGAASTLIFASGYDFAFRVYQFHYQRYGQYQSDVYNAGGFVKSWGTFNANYNAPAGTHLSWYVSVATASVFCSSYNIVALTDGYDVPYSSVPFIMIFASMSTTNIGYTPRIDDYLVYLYASEAQNPIPSMVHDDRYITAITTPTTAKNGLVWVCNKDFAWVRQIYTGMYPYSMATYRDAPYFGDNTTGRTHRIDVEDVYDDNGSAYNCSILTGDLDFGYPNNEKDYTRAYTKAKNSGPWTLDWGYNFNGSTQAITCDKNVNLGLADRIINIKTPFPRGSKAYYIKLQLQNNTSGQWFDWRGTDVYYNVPVEPIR